MDRDGASEMTTLKGKTQKNSSAIICKQLADERMLLRKLPVSILSFQV